MYPDVSGKGDSAIPDPTKIPSNQWVDNMKIWPKTEAPQIVYYLVQSKACDLKDMKAFKSLESFNYLQSGWVSQVMFYRVNEEMCLLKAEVMPSQALSSCPHTAWVCIKEDGNIVTAGCTCMAGKGKACSHVGAILWKVDMANRKGLTGHSCTDESSRWNTSTKRNVEPALLQEINFKKPNRMNLDVIRSEENSQQNPVDQHFTQEDLLTKWKASPIAPLLDIPGTILHDVATAKLRSPLKDKSNISPINHSNHNDGSSCRVCVEFYNKYVNIEKTIISKLEKQTVSQSQSPIWRESRRLRLTASTASRVPKKQETNPQKFLISHLYKPFKGNHATRYGIENEENARQEFSKKMGMSVVLCGTMISEQEPWLSASPDGLIGSDSCIEIKCPLAKTLPEALKRTDVINKDGTLILNPKGAHGYYLQVQLTMFCSVRKKCYFFVWLPKDENGYDRSTVLIVPFDERFFTLKLDWLKRFYFHCMLPRMADDLHLGTLSIKKEYKSLLQEVPIKIVNAFT